MEIKYTGEKSRKTVYGTKPYYEETEYIFDKANKMILEVSPTDKEAIRFLLHPDRKGLFKVVDKDETKVLESGEIIALETPKEAPKVETPKEAPKVETPKEAPKVETPKEAPKKKGRPKKK